MLRHIYHLNVNSAYLALYVVRKVNLGADEIRLISSATGGDREKCPGVILVKSIPAWKFGIGDCIILAKMASIFEKLDEVHTLYWHETPQKT